MVLAVLMEASSRLCSMDTNVRRSKASCSVTVQVNFSP